MPQQSLGKHAATSPLAAKKKASAAGKSSSSNARAQKKGRTQVAPRQAQKLQAAKLQKKLATAINRNIEETLAAKASTVKSLKVLGGVASAGANKLAADPKAGRTGRAVKGLSKKK